MKWIGNISKKNIILHGGEVLRAVVVFVYSSVGRVLFKKAILVVVLESILQQRDQETPSSVVISGSGLKAVSSLNFFFCCSLWTSQDFVFILINATVWRCIKSEGKWRLKGKEEEAQKVVFHIESLLQLCPALCTVLW